MTSSSAKRIAIFAMQVSVLVVVFWYRPFDGWLGVILPFVLELTILTWVGIKIFRSVRRARAAHHMSSDGRSQIRDVVLAAFPGPFGHIILLEVATWMSLWRMCTRWRAPKARIFSYHKGSVGFGMLVVILLTAPVEILLFELLIPWAIVRWILLIAAIYSVIWFAGMTVGPMVYPHVLDAGDFTIRNGPLTRIDIPLSNIKSTARAHIDWPESSGVIPLTLVVHDDTAFLPGHDSKQLLITLRQPQAVGPTSNDPPVSSIIFTADEPDALIEAIETQTLKPANTDDNPASPSLELAGSTTG